MILTIEEPGRHLVATEVDGWAIMVLKGWYPAVIDHIYEIHVVRDLARRRLKELDTLNAGKVRFEIRKTKVYVTA